MILKKLYIFLTRTESVVSKAVHLVTNASYTHSAIAFDESLIYLYSSARKNGINMFPAGPCQESLDRGFYKRDEHTPCAVYELCVEDEVFDSARAIVDGFMKEQELYKFSALGLIACRLGIRWVRERKYFCSQFVGEILTRSGAVALPKEPCLTKPLDFASLPEVQKIFEGDIKGLKSFIKEKEPVTV